jgi:hypothetical protein
VGGSLLRGQSTMVIRTNHQMGKIGCSSSKCRIIIIVVKGFSLIDNNNMTIILNSRKVSILDTNRLII